MMASFTKVSKSERCMYKNELDNVDWRTTTFIISTTHSDGCTIFGRRDRSLA